MNVIASRSLLPLLLFLAVLLLSIPAHALTQAEVDKCVGRGFMIYKTLRSDLDGDGQPEIIVGLQPTPPYYDVHSASLLLLHRSRTGKLKKLKFWSTNTDYRSFSTDGNTMEDETMCCGSQKSPLPPRNGLQVRDMDGDGHSDLVFVVAYMQCSEAYFQLRVWTVRHGKIVSLLAHPLLYHLRGGMLIDALLSPTSRQGDKRAKQRGPSILVWDFIWGDGESHGEPHHYTVNCYQFRRGEFRRVHSFVTRHKYAESLDMPQAIKHQLRAKGMSGLRIL